MITVLADHDIEGFAVRLLDAITAMGWQELVSLKLVTLADVGLLVGSSDRVVWRFAQAQGMVLLTGNRNMDDEDSLELTMREENKPTSLPVITIGNLQRMEEADYRRRCAERLVEIVLDLDTFRGTRRLFIP